LVFNHFYIVIEIADRVMLIKNPMITPLSILLWTTLAIVTQACSNGSGQSSVPENIPEKIRTASKTARKDWKSDSMLARLLIERPDAKSLFIYDYVFASSSSPKLMHLTESSSGAKMEEKEFRPSIETVPGTLVIDLPKAIQIARSAGMKGNLLTAELKQWSYDEVDPPSVPVIIWRLVPDNDPNTVDPNDPNMKNYYIDALTSHVYDQDKPDNKELLRGSEAMGAAISTEMTEFIKAMQRGR
jgi:hypothetical protein